MIKSTDSRARVLIGTTIDPDAQLTVSAALSLELPDAVVLRYEQPDPARSGIRRLISDVDGVLYDDVIGLDHDCVSCTVLGDVSETVGLLLDLDQWSTALLLPPATCSPGPFAAELAETLADRTDQPSLGPVLCFVQHAQLIEDLMGDDLLDERGISLSGRDRRSVGEALSAQLELADVVVGLDHPTARTRTLLDHLVIDKTTRVDYWTELDGHALVQLHHDVQATQTRTHPLTAAPTGAPDEHDVWTLDLRTMKPLNPHRLMEQLADLGSGRIRSRGHFWLASRPSLACAWDGCGGQVSIGPLGEWEDHHPRGTRLVITGVDPADRARIRAAFAEIATAPPEDDEPGPAEDGFDPWLGPVSSLARAS